MKPSLLLSGLLFIFAICFGAVAIVPEPTLDLSSIESGFSPGDDFYQYANGGWLARNPIPPEFSIWGGFVELAERNRAILHEILEKTAQADSLAKAEPGSIQQKLGDFYASGMDESTINREGISPLQRELGRIDQVQDKAEFASEIADLHAKGLGPLFDLDGDQDEKDSSKQIAILTQGGLGLPDRYYYLNPDDRSKDIRAQYLVHLRKIFELMGEPGEAAGQDAQADANLGEALGELYVQKTFPPAAKQRALAMVNDLKVALRRKIETLDWMGDETKKAALET
jgi:putative endopeptidase